MDQASEEWLGAFLTKKEWRLTTAESCTGGLIAHRITNVSGSSNYFERGFITYSNEAKMEILKVSEDVLIAHGAVSESCARAMAEGVKKVSGAEIGLSVTGIAGPSGGSPEKPVGTVFMAASLPSGTICERFLFHGDRLRIKEQTADRALQMLREALQKEE